MCPIYWWWLPIFRTSLVRGFSKEGVEISKYESGFGTNWSVINDSTPASKSVCSLCTTCSVPQSEVVCCSVLQCAAVCYSVLQGVAVCCSVLQCVAVCYSALQGVAGCCSELQCVAVCYSVLQGVAGCCRVLQRVAAIQSELRVIFDYGMTTIIRLLKFVGLFCRISSLL